MARPRVAAGGGLAAVAYVLRKGREAGGLLRLYRRLRSRNACKTCALGMGGQQGGMVDEAGRFPEVCKKSVQAQAGDMPAPIAEPYFRATPIAALERLGSAELERLGRLAFPLVAADGDTHFRRVSWAEALDRAGAALRAAPPEEVFFYSSGRSSNEAAFLMQLAARAYGTANIHNCSFYCHNASSVALAQVYGSGTASITLEDLAQADLVLVAGANPASNHPRRGTQLVALRRRRGSVVVVNPLRELGLVRFRVPSDWRSMLFGSTVSDLYLQPHVGADVALFKALLKGVVEAGGVDRAFVAAHTSGWEAVEADLAATPWDALLDASGVARSEIEHAGAILLRARHGIFLWAMGLPHHVHGVGNGLALANLAPALRRLALTVSITTKLNEGHVHGRGQTAIVLPVLARDEESQCTTQESMFNYVRLSEGGEPAVDGDLRSEVEVIAALAELILPPGRFDWSAFRSHQRLRQEMAKRVPGYGAIGDIDRTRREFHVAGRVLHAPPFPTGDGKAHFHVTPLPAFAPPAGEFRLMTLRSEGQFNTVVYEEEDLYRGNRQRDVVMMAAEDAARLGLGEGDPVVVETETGRLRVTAAIAELRPGNLAMYYPEANALVPRRLDARSRTPAFKSVLARLRPANGAEAGGMPDGAAPSGAGPSWRSGRLG